MKMSKADVVAVLQGFLACSPMDRQAMHRSMCWDDDVEYEEDEEVLGLLEAVSNHFEAAWFFYADSYDDDVSPSDD